MDIHVVDIPEAHALQRARGLSTSVAMMKQCYSEKSKRATFTKPTKLGKISLSLNNTHRTARGTPRATLSSQEDL
jgi:hypothetical protein